MNDSTPQQITGFAYADIEIGATASFVKTVHDQDLHDFAKVSGDRNPLHLDDAYAATTPFGERIAHGMITGAIISAAIVQELPGPGSVYVEQQMSFRAPVKPGDTLTVKLEVLEKLDKRRLVTLDCKVFNQDERCVVKGQAKVIASETAITLTLA